MVIEEKLNRILANQKILLRSLQFDPNLKAKGITAAINATKKVLNRKVEQPCQN